MVGRMGGGPLDYGTARSKHAPSPVILDPLPSSSSEAKDLPPVAHHTVVPFTASTHDLPPSPRTPMRGPRWGERGGLYGYGQVGCTGVRCPAALHCGHSPSPVRRRGGVRRRGAAIAYAAALAHRAVRGPRRVLRVIQPAWRASASLLRSSPSAVLAACRRTGGWRCVGRAIRCVT